MSPFATPGWGQPLTLAERLKRSILAAPQPSNPTAPKPISKPPAGFYDPTIDAQERAGARGVGDLAAATDQANIRALDDLTVGRGRMGEDRDTSLAGLLRGKTRGLEDIGTGRQRLEEDYGSAVAARRRAFTELGSAQGQSAQAAGVAGGGALKAALAKRTADEGIQAAAQKQARDRGMQDFDTTGRRIGEDYDTGVQGVQRDYQRSYDDAGTGYQRGVDDRAVQLGIAGREQVFLGTDAAALRNFQAAQAGYVPPAKKKRKGKR